jgi:exodeoxyribonuclease-3
MATTGLAERALSAVVEKAADYTERWSDHAPVTCVFDWDFASVPAQRLPLGSSHLEAPEATA